MRKHTDETKKKLSEARRKYLKENPDKHPWRRDAKKDSEPCKKLKEILKEAGFSYVEELQPLLHMNKFYSADISFPEKRLIIEVNGNQHYETC